MNRGFTLVEILMVIAIVIIIGSIGLANYHSREKDTLIWEAEKVASLLKQAQSYTFQAKERTIEGETFRPTGYGVFFYKNNNQLPYIFYSDLNGDHLFTEEEKIIEYFLSRNIVFEFEDTCTHPDILDVLFAMPESTVYKCGWLATNPIIIILKETATNQSKSVIVNPFSKGIDIQ